MEEIKGWFPQTNKDTLEMLIKQYNVQTVIEIGTFVGLSAVWFADRIKEVVTIDPFDSITRINYLHGDWKEAAKEQYYNFVKNTAGYNNIVCLKMTSAQAFAGPLKDVKADLIYIDGSHEYEDVKLDILNALPRANKVVCGDDYTASWPGVKRAVDELTIPVNKKQRCWFIIK